MTTHYNTPKLQVVHGHLILAADRFFGRVFDAPLPVEREFPCFAPRKGEFAGIHSAARDDLVRKLQSAGSDGHRS